MRYFQSTLTNSFSCFSQYSRVLLYKTIPIQFLIFFFFTFLREKLYFMVFSRLIVASTPYVLSLLLVLSFAPTESFFSRYSGFPPLHKNQQPRTTNQFQFQFQFQFDGSFAYLNPQFKNSRVLLG